MILEWILLIPITGFQQRPLLWFSVNSYTLNFEKGFGKLLKSYGNSSDGRNPKKPFTNVTICTFLAQKLVTPTEK